MNTRTFHRLARASALAAVFASASASDACAQWSTMNLSANRQGLAATSVGDLAIFAGGLNNAGPSSRVDIYNTATDTWTTDELSVARVYLAAASVGTKALFAGGGDNLAVNQSSVVDIYDNATGQWTTANLAEPRSNLSAVTVGDKVLFAGGYWSDIVDIYDDSTQTWTTTNLSSVRAEMSATVIGDKAYFAGGWDGSSVVDTVDVYDAATGTWSLLTLPTGRNRMAAASIGNVALFAGGSINGPDSGVDIVSALDTTTDSWSNPTTIDPREFFAATRVGNKVIFGGGFRTPQTIVDSVEIYDASTDTWSTDNLSQARWGLAATTASNMAFFAGGRRNGGPSRRVDVYTDSIAVDVCAPAAMNSTGQPGVLEASGSATVSRQNLTLQASSLPLNQFGFFIVSMDEGFVQMPGGSQGDLCLGGAIGRYNMAGQILNSGATGSFQLTPDLGQTPTPSGLVPILPNTTWVFQAWYRDQNPMQTSNFTQALSIGFN